MLRNLTKVFQKLGKLSFMLKLQVGPLSEAPEVQILLVSMCVCACIDYFAIPDCFTTNNLCNYRTASKSPGNNTDLDVYRSSQLLPALTVSSNFEVVSSTIYFLIYFYLCHPLRSNVLFSEHTSVCLNTKMHYCMVCISLSVLICPVSNFIFP